MKEFLKIFFLLLLYAALASVLAVFPYAVITYIFFDFLPGFIAILPLLAIFGPLLSLLSLFIGAWVCVWLDKLNKATVLNLAAAGMIAASVCNTVIFKIFLPLHLQIQPSLPIFFSIAGAMTGYFLWRWYYRPKAVPQVK